MADLRAASVHGQGCPLCSKSVQQKLVEADPLAVLTNLGIDITEE